MFPYLKTSEVVNYCPRVAVPAGKELMFSTVASRLIDSFCGRTLSIQYYLLDFELSRGMAGQIPKRPIVALAPTVLTTGIQVRPLMRTSAGGRELMGQWQDIAIPLDINDLFNPRTGRFELSSTLIGDFGRMDFPERQSGSRTVYAWLAKMEAYIGHFVDTNVTTTAIAGASTVTLDSVIGITQNVTRLNFGDSTAAYLVTNVVGQVITISPVLPTGGVAAGISATQVVPEDIKIATGQTIEDRLTYEPNTNRQTETLDIITDRFARMGNSPVPVDAQRLLTLGRYKN